MTRTIRPSRIERLIRFRLDSRCSSSFARLADDHPVLCVVDDAHWLDPSSVAALEFAVRRMEGDRVAFLFACRDGEPGASRFDGFDHLVVAPLSAAASTALVGDRMAGPVASQVVEAAAGNPLVLIEACRLLPEAQRQGRAPLQTPLPVPSAIECELLTRTRRRVRPMRAWRYSWRHATSDWTVT